MPKGAKFLLTIIVCFLALGSGLLNWHQRHVEAGPQIKEPEWLTVFPRYPRTLEGAYSIGDEMTMNGLPMQAAYMRTEDNMQQISDFYAGVWTSQGFKPQVDEFNEANVVIAINDMAKSRYLTVNIIDMGKERLIMPAIHLWPTVGDNDKGSKPAIFNPPVPEVAREIHDQEMVTNGLGSAAKIYEVPLSIAVLMDFYYKVMPNLGFKLSRQVTEQEIDMLFWEAGKISIVISMSVISAAPPVSMLSFAYLEEP